MATGTFDMAKALNDTATGVSAPGVGSPAATGAAGLLAPPGGAADAPAGDGGAAGAGEQALPSHPPSSKRIHRARIVVPPSRVTIGFLTEPTLLPGRGRSGRTALRRSGRESSPWSRATAPNGRAAPAGSPETRCP